MELNLGLTKTVDTDYNNLFMRDKNSDQSLI